MSELIAFIGIGNMGSPMAENLVKAGKSVKVFDASASMIEKAKEKKLEVAENLDELITKKVTTVITMLPEGKNSKEVYLGDNGIINKVSKNCLLIDCSTIDIQTSIEIGKKASEKGIKMIDAPVSGGVMGAQKATLNIMVGGSKEAFDTIGGVNSGDVAAFFAGQAVGKNVFTRATGKVMNPNLELLFTGPNLRSFAYSFRFTPREDAEARMVRSIIKMFKKAMAPRRKGGKLFLESPHVFKLKYYFKNGQEHPFLNKIKTCALQSFNVQYAPDGSYMTYDDGSMTSYQMSLNFGELNPIYNDEIDMSSNDMGF